MANVGCGWDGEFHRSGIGMEAVEVCEEAKGGRWWEEFKYGGERGEEK